MSLQEQTILTVNCFNINIVECKYDFTNADKEKLDGFNINIVECKSD